MMMFAVAAAAVGVDDEAAAVAAAVVIVVVVAAVLVLVNDDDDAVTVVPAAALILASAAFSPDTLCTLARISLRSTRCRTASPPSRDIRPGQNRRRTDYTGNTPGARSDPGPSRTDPQLPNRIYCRTENLDRLK